MAKGVTSVTYPVSNDLALGEAIVYADYELPTQHIIGATRGGFKLNVERSIKEMKFDGAYGPIKGLRRYEKFMAKLTLEQLCLKHNTHDLISDPDLSTSVYASKDWGDTGGTYAVESSIVRQGNYSAKCTANTINFGIHDVFTATKDLTAFANGETSDTADKIGLNVYIATQDIADLNSGNIQIGFHMDAFGTETNMYTYDIAAASLVNGWNTVSVAKSAFTEVGSGDWSAVLGFSAKLDGAPSAEVIFYVDGVTMMQTNSTLKSSLLPVEAGGFDVSDETTYFKYTPNLEINQPDYYENVAVIGQKNDGKVFAIFLYNCLNDGAINLGLDNKDEVVNSTVFTAHYKQTALTTIPFKIRDYDV